MIRALESLSSAPGMYFVRYSPLKEKLRTRTLTDREALPYLLFCVFFSYFALIPIAFESTTQDWASWGTSLFIGLLGTIYAYRKNGGSEGFDLIQKIILLGWVLFIRMIPLLILAGIVSCLPLLADEDNAAWLGIIPVILFEIIFFQRLGRHIADTRR